MHAFDQDSAAVCTSIQDEMEREGQGESTQLAKIRRAQAALNQVVVLFFCFAKNESYRIH